MRVLALVAVVTVGSLSACSKPACDRSNCSVGCCDASGTCQAGNTANACGIGGNTCTTCQFTQSCMQGACFGGNTGGSGGTGGGSGGTGGGSAQNGLSVFPTNASVPYSSSLTLSAALEASASSPDVSFSLEQSATGQLSRLNNQTAVYYAPNSGSARTVRIRATADYNTSVSQLIELTLAPSSAVTDAIFPSSRASTVMVVGVGEKQTFAVTRYVTPTQLSSLTTAEWFRWPSGQSFAATYTGDANVKRIYARDPATNQYLSTDVSTIGLQRVSVEISPASATVAPNGVIQFTATASDGSAVDWMVLNSGGGDVGTVNSGTYTAPAAPGIYLVAAFVGQVAATDASVAVATVIVQ